MLAIPAVLAPIVAYFGVAAGFLLSQDAVYPVACGSYDPAASTVKFCADRLLEKLDAVAVTIPFGADIPLTLSIHEMFVVSGLLLLFISLIVPRRMRNATGVSKLLTGLILLAGLAAFWFHPLFTNASFAMLILMALVGVAPIGSAVAGAGGASDTGGQRATRDMDETPQPAPLAPQKPLNN